MGSIPPSWHDLANLINPIGGRAGPPADGRLIAWYDVYGLAASHLVAPTLYAKLVSSDRLEWAPQEVRDALGELHRLNKENNDRQRSVLRDTVRILNDHGIEPLLMKGAITLLADQPPIFATRMMGDLDIALHNAEPEHAEAVLVEAGYWYANGEGPQSYPKDQHHLAPLFHPSGEGYVEIHRRILCDKVPAAALSLAEVRAAAEPAQLDGLRLWIPSIRHRLLHNALHHQVQDGVRHITDRCSLRQLLEFVQLCASTGSTAIDWREETSRLDACGMGDPVRAYFLLASQIFAQPLPPGIQIAAAVGRAEKVKWFWYNHPRLYGLFVFSIRLRRLPAKLVTPGWYPQKYRQLRRDWTEKA